MGIKVDFDGLSDRLTTYRDHEARLQHAATECKLAREVAHV